MFSRANGDGAVTTVITLGPFDPSYSIETKVRPAGIQSGFRVRPAARKKGDKLNEEVNREFVGRPRKTLSVNSNRPSCRRAGFG
jgi:hypothetical protein